MNHFRSEKYTERIEDVVFELETPIIVQIPNAAHQTKTNYRFVADNVGEISPFDWFNSKILVDFKIELLADGGNVAIDDHNGIVNGSHSLISAIIVKINGILVYDNNAANHSVALKNVLEYNSSYANSTATNQLFYLDTNRHAEERVAQAAYNKGFAMRKALLGVSATVNKEIPLNRYSFFESFENELMPNAKVEILLTLESDANLIWQAGANCRIKILKMQLWIPRITFSSEGQTQYISKYLKPHKWSYLREIIMRGNSTQNASATVKITSGITRPRYVFVWISNDANQESQTANPFLYNTFNVVNNRTLINAHLEISNGLHYPENEYQPSTSISRVFKDILNYVHGNNDYGGGTLLTRSNFETIFPFLFFDLTHQKADIKDGTTKIDFKYKLSAGTNADYSVYSLVLYEQDIELIQSNGKLILRS